MRRTHAKEIACIRTLRAVLPVLVLIRVLVPGLVFGARHFRTSAAHTLQKLI